MVAAATPAVAVTEVVVVVVIASISLTSHRATLHPRLKNIAPK